MMSAIQSAKKTSDSFSTQAESILRDIQKSPSLSTADIQHLRELFVSLQQSLVEYKQVTSTLNALAPKIRSIANAIQGQSGAMDPVRRLAAQTFPSASSVPSWQTILDKMPHLPNIDGLPIRGIESYNALSNAARDIPQTWPSADSMNGPAAQIQSTIADAQTHAKSIQDSVSSGSIDLASLNEQLKSVDKDLLSGKQVQPLDLTNPLPNGIPDVPALNVSVEDVQSTMNTLQSLLSQILEDLQLKSLDSALPEDLLVIASNMGDKNWVSLAKYIFQTISAFPSFLLWMFQALIRLNEILVRVIPILQDVLRNTPKYIVKTGEILVETTSKLKTFFIWTCVLLTIVALLALIFMMRS
jgi:predicted  nucleic acid-binding Zn-ribbon protein